MTPFYERGGIVLYVGDSLDVVPTLEPESVSAVITDPPYGLGFMGKAWDHSVPGVPFWEAFAGVMLPGAHLAAFGGSRTFHRMGVAIEDSGLELRDTLMWLYGSGFPKSHDVSKAIDKAAGKERASDYQPNYKNTTHGKGWGGGVTTRVDPPATPVAAQWAGWGTALKPAYEPIILARKALAGTVAANVLAHGTGALNIDASRIDTNGEALHSSSSKLSKYRGNVYFDSSTINVPSQQHTAGRWPANVILDETAAAALDRQSGVRAAGARPKIRNADASRTTYGAFTGTSHDERIELDSGGASRFFYCAKASRRERNAGLDGMPERTAGGMQKSVKGGVRVDTRPGRTNMEMQPVTAQNHHPTVKPLALMRYLITLLTPPGGVVLDPFAGSGTTLVACAELGIRAIGIELTPEYAPIIAARIDYALDERARLQAQPEAPTGKQGRWPSNVLMDRAAADALDQQSGVTVSKRSKRGDLADHRGDNYNAANGRRIAGSDYERGHNDTGGASRFMTVLDDDADVTQLTIFEGEVAD